MFVWIKAFHTSISKFHCQIFPRALVNLKWAHLNVSLVTRFISLVPQSKKNMYYALYGSSVEFSRRQVAPDLTGRLFWLRQLFCLWPKSSWSILDDKPLGNWPDCLFGALNSDLTLPSSLCLFSSSCLLKNNLGLISKPVIYLHLVLRFWNQVLT